MAFTEQLARKRASPSAGRLTDIKTRLHFSSVKSPLAVSRLPRAAGEVSRVRAYHRQRQSREVLLAEKPPHSPLSLHCSPLKPLVRGLVQQAALQRPAVAVSPVRVRLASSDVPQPPRPPAAIADPCHKSQVISALNKKRKRWPSAELAVDGVPVSLPARLNEQGPSADDCEPLSKRRRDAVSKPEPRRPVVASTVTTPAAAAAHLLKPAAQPVASQTQHLKPTGHSSVKILVPDIDYESSSSEDEEESQSVAARELLTAVFAPPHAGSSRRKVPIFCATGAKPHLPVLQAVCGGSADLQRDREAAAARLSRYFSQESCEEVEEAPVGGSAGKSSPLPAEGRCKSVSFAVPLTTSSLVTSLPSASTPAAIQQPLNAAPLLTAVTTLPPDASQQLTTTPSTSQSTIPPQQPATLSGLLSQQPATLSGLLPQQPATLSGLLPQQPATLSGLLPQQPATLSGLLPQQRQPPHTHAVVNAPPPRSAAASLSTAAAPVHSLKAPTPAAEHTIKSQASASTTRNSFTFKLSSPAISLPNLSSLPTQQPTTPSAAVFSFGNQPSLQQLPSSSQNPAFQFGAAAAPLQSVVPGNTPGFQFSAAAPSLSFTAGQAGATPTARPGGTRRNRRSRK